MARPRTNDPALVWPSDEQSSEAAQTFPGFPGVWTQGEPIALSELGLTAEEAEEMIRDRSLPLVMEGVKGGTETSEE